MASFIVAIDLSTILNYKALSCADHLAWSHSSTVILVSGKHYLFTMGYICKVKLLFTQLREGLKKTMKVRYFHLNCLG